VTREVDGSSLAEIQGGRERGRNWAFVVLIVGRQKDSVTPRAGGGWLVSSSRVSEWWDRCWSGVDDLDQRWCERHGQDGDRQVAWASRGHGGRGAAVDAAVFLLSTCRRWCGTSRSRTSSRWRSKPSEA